ncbi:MAG: PA0069 family radical SAM protein [Flavobacteriaceae bacterium]
MQNKSYLKGRGAQGNPSNRFLELEHETLNEFLEYCSKNGEVARSPKTKYIPVYPKTVINPVNSPDVPMKFSMNPYQGCEHGCIYCYARNTHEFWGYSAGLDFEQQILVKEEAPVLLEQKLRKKSWKAETIVLSGNTDCYQPAEQKFKLTRACLEVFLKYRHPVGIITKNSLVLRDIDLIEELAQHNLVGVHISLTSLNENTRRVLEPRTTSIKKRLETIRILSEKNIPVNAMLAPIIPGINSHEILDLARRASENGAISFALTIVRLNGAIGQIFTDWIRKAMPAKADKVLGLIAACHGGKLNDSRFGLRVKGEGQIARQINDLGKLAKNRYFKDKAFPSLNRSMHQDFKDGQLRLF